MEAHLINPQTLKRLQNETGPGFQRVLALFLKNLPNRLDALSSAWQAKDWEELRQAAHKLKGVSATFGAERFSGCCAMLEQEAAQGTLLEGVPEILEELLAEGERARQELQRFLSDSPAQ
jgi:HPt (histidine-containing phosphotransfer) domain-containing protein